MYIKTLKLLICCAMAMFAIGCQPDNGGDDNGGTNGGDELYEKSGYNVMGTVTCNGVGIQGVVVSDGLKVTKTDASGRFWLKCDLSFTPEVFISVPSGYETVDRMGTGMAFYRYTEKTDKTQVFHFTLKEVDQSNYELLALADSHVLGGAKGGKYSQGSTLDCEFYNETFIPAFRAYVKRVRAEGRPIYAVHSGDMTQQTAWSYYGVQEYCDDTKVVEEIAIFNALGNHDHDHCNQANNKQAYTESNQQLSRKSFRKAVGPGYYSFNIGTEHYVVLDNMLIKKHETDYIDKVDPLQIAWLKKDIQNMDKKKIKGIVVVMHSAYNGLDNKSELLEIFKDYPVTYIIGHHHMDRTYISTHPTTGKTIKEFWTPTLAGVAWLHTICGDGTPRSYISYRFKNGEVTDRVFKTFDDEFKNNTKSYRIYDNSENSAVDYPVHQASGNYIKRAEEEAYEDANDNLLPAAVINAWGAYTCEYTGSEDILVTAGNQNLYDLSYRDWYWVSHASTDRNSINAAANNGQGPAHQLPSKAIFHIWRFAPKSGSVKESTLPITLKDAQGKETRVTLRLR